MIPSVPVPMKPKSRIAWLHSILSDGPLRASEIESLARKERITLANLRSAKQKLGVRAWKDGYQGVWWWELPADSLTEQERSSLELWLIEYAVSLEDEMMRRGMGLDWPTMVHGILGEIDKRFSITRKAEK